MSSAAKGLMSHSLRGTARSYHTPLGSFDSVQAGRHTQQRHSTIIARSQDLDVQVFRFTLGIPGFDDANIPRLIGAVGATLLTVNHVLTAQPVPDTQVLIRNRFLVCL